MRTDLFDYDLPPELIAQEPSLRGESRLLVLDRAARAVSVGAFADLAGLLRPGDVLVVNDTRVSARRVFGEIEGGAPMEALLLAPRGACEWTAMVRPGRKLRPGARLTLALADGSAAAAAITGTLDGGLRVLEFESAAVRDRMASEGTVPLPPYIHRRLDDEERYQTVFAGPPGSAAAPTAGLHFPPGALDALRSAGVAVATITLHVGIDTFRPVREETLDRHVMHGEWFTVPEETARAVRGASGRVVAVGTTAVRALESAARGPRDLSVGQGVTHLFITPGYRFQVVDAILTNFHLPKSTLLMLISAFAGREAVMDAYRQAVEARMRFYSFGDAMLIV